MAVAPVPLPPPAGPGDRVGVAALSGPVDPERLERGLAALAELGFEPVVADNLASRAGPGDLWAGDDSERLAAFHRLARRDDLSVIFFARGGWGALRLLDGIDWDLLARRPRAWVGYSDLTPFLDAVVRRLGHGAFHGPMVAADLARGLDDAERRSLLSALAGAPAPVVPVPRWLRRPQGHPETGPLLGGCLSLLGATQGTPWAPDLDGAVLFFEDVHEPSYRLDRLLTHLRLSGSLSRVRGIVAGHCVATDAAPAAHLDHLARLVTGAVPEGPSAIGLGLPAGHDAPNLTLPLGLAVRLDPRAGGLTLV